jgi:carbon-monoxide dehydrogenase large subunit
MKGMGEDGVVAPPAAIADAVRDALSAIGAEVNETPITPRRVMAAIAGAPNGPQDGWVWRRRFEMMKG